MKNIKKIIALVLALALTFAVAACGASDSGKKTIGIIQFGSHGSLNNCYDGIMQGLEENGITEDEYNIEYVNSNFDPSVSQTQANNLVNKNAAVIIAIATPSAVAAANAAADTEEVSFTAVPAKMPKASPEAVLKPMAWPSRGNSSAASTLKKKITEMAWATSSSSAWVILLDSKP